MKCNICPRKCNIDREKQLGFCGEGEKIRIAKVIPSFMWEEPPISGKRGTFAIFFSGCSLRCKFCQNYEISRGGKGKLYSVEEFAELLKEADKSDSESIDLITPTHFTNQILQALKSYKSKKKIVWNSSGYETIEAIEQVAPYISIFLPDFKYFDNSLSLEKSLAKDYFEVASKAVKRMNELCPNVWQKGELIQGVIIRHLVLPGCVKDSFKVLDFIAENIKDPVVSFMSQFVPSGEEGEGRKLAALEYKSVLAHAKKLGLEKGFFQEQGADSEEFIPDFK